MGFAEDFGLKHNFSSPFSNGSFDFWYTKFYERMNCSLKSDNETSCFTGMLLLHFLEND